jgi:CDGSH-type Zn-finger protein
MNNKKVTIQKNGPYIVSGGVPLAKEFMRTDHEEFPVRWEKGASYPVRETYSLCRCGKTKKHPWCDNTHTNIGFNGTETAEKKPYLKQAEKIIGPDLILYDDVSLCAIARFCDRAGGVWGLTEKSDDTAAKKMAIQEACDCPSGRLVAADKKTGKLIEPAFEPAISLIEDPQENVSGPLWVKGGIPLVSSDGACYETRNRVTLCRCGQSKNKPFCDGNHIDSNFKDDDASVNK